MSGKSYTMREMKAIVEYLTEHKAYNEIKGRKMWIELQDAKVVNRTWQSLKETFIKRILPDINNPYYKLSIQQISSFKQGYDVEARINNRLEVRSVSQDSNKEGENQKNSEEPDSHKDKTGEDNKQADIRDSTETLVLENYEEQEDKQDEVQGQSQSKTLRELITYSEPLTPMLQAVIDDFTSDGDGSNDEPKMQIVEASESDIIQSNAALIVVLEGSDEEKIVENKEKTNEETTNNNGTETLEQNDKDNNDESSILLDGSEIPPNKVHTLENRTNTTENHNSESKSIENSSNLTTDTFLPDNQEALKDKESKTNVPEKADTLKVNSLKRGKRRAISQESQTISKKRLLDSEKKTNSDVDTLKRKNEKIDLKKLKQNVAELVEEKPSRVSPENDNQKGDDNQNISVDKDEHTADNSECLKESVDQTKNSCVENVNLSNAQKYTNNIYTDSENTNNGNTSEKNKAEDESRKNKTVEVTKNVTMSEKINEIVVLRSNSDSVSDSDKPPAKRVPDKVRQQRDRALANMFGFASGGVTKNRRRASSFRKHSTSRRKSHNISTDSSEWTSDTGSEYVSPPRGRKNKQTRKYLKPKSARVLSLEEEGGLFVMYGKKIYPVVKDGKIIKNYVSFVPEDDVDPDESYWKLKYVEEKKRTAELTKLLTQVKDKNEREERVPEVPSTSAQQLNTEYIQSPVKREAEKTSAENAIVPVKKTQVNKVEAGAEEKTVKVKFTKNNEEVQLEGHWSHVNPVLAQVLQLLQKEPEGRRPSAKRDSVSEVSSVKSSSVIVNEQDVRERVDKLESEIFKEIEQIEKEVETVEKISTPNKSPAKPDLKSVAKSDDSVEKSEENVTKRKGRPKRSIATPSGATPAKNSKIELNIEEEKPIAARRTPRTPRNASENNNVKENNTPKTRQIKTTPNKTKKSVGNEDDAQDVRYKLPSTNKNVNTSGKEVNTRLRKSNSPERFKIYTSPDMSHNSIDSMDYYIDSDPSPVISIRKKKSLSFSCSSYRLKYRPRSRHSFHPSLTDDLTSDSSNSFQGPVRTITFENSSISSNVYRSESYQLLMNNNVSVFNKNTSQKLDKINEIDPNLQEMEVLSDQNNDIFNVQEKDNSGQKDTISLTNTDSQCSNMTMPTSPVLSIVENISINKSAIDNFDFNDEEEMADNCTNKTTPNDLMVSGIDVTMPLMEQECYSNTAMNDGNEYHYNLRPPKTSVVSESLLNKINSVNIDDPPSDSINDKLKDLILESTKKGTKKKDNVRNNMEQDISENVNTKKAKPSKRSSTPRKRQSTRKLKFTQNEPCIEDEHMETCSQIGRKSCPPVIQFFDEINNNNDSIATIDPKYDKPKRKKKDVIKVKITKPKKKSNESTDSCVQEKQSYTQTDSGINDTGSIHLQISEDSVDLIHNHSETCLNANECLDPSVEVIENLTKSIISLDSSSLLSNAGCNDNYSDNYGILAQELHCSDAQDGTQMNKVISVTNTRNENTTATVFHTPLGSLSPPTSLITEDLSIDIPTQVNRNTKWYLFSEDETTNTNNFDIDQAGAQSSYGANLNQIFPITCAVPNLSTITELSKDNEENTRKFSEDTNTINDIDMHSLFTKY